MPAQLTLFFSNSNGHEQEVPIKASQFSIGRGENNDYVANDAGVSRRHALITFFNDIAQITDCGSANGIFVNGQQVTGTATLKNGDVFKLGRDYCVRVALTTIKAPPEPVNTVPPTMKPNSTSGNIDISKFSPTLIAGISSSLIVLVAIAAILILKLTDRRTITPSNQPTPIVENSRISTTLENSLSPTPHQEPSSPSDAPNDPIETLANQLINNVSNDKSYVFDPEVLSELKQRVAQYSNPTVINAIRSFDSLQGNELAKATRSEGLNPALVFYVGLAATNGGQNGNAFSAARAAIPQLKYVGIFFGMKSADEVLMSVAASQMSGGTVRYHPLERCATSEASKNPTANRNVWFLHKHGHKHPCVDDAVYDFVLKFLAYGIIAQKAK